MKTPHHIPNFGAGAIRPFFLVSLLEVGRLKPLLKNFIFLALSSRPLLLYASPLAVGFTAFGLAMTRLILGSSVVEQAAVNRLVAGSSPARGATSP